MYIYFNQFYHPSVSMAKGTIISKNFLPSIQYWQGSTLIKLTILINWK
jgi:hypothetical protein